MGVQTMAAEKLCQCDPVSDSFETDPICESFEIVESFELAKFLNCVGGVDMRGYSFTKTFVRGCSPI